MKKKILNMMIISIMVICLSGCGTGDSSSNDIVTVINNMGETEKISIEELGDLNCSNNQKFEKYYKEAKVTFDAKVTSIRSDTVECAVLNCAQSDVINFEGGAAIALVKGKYDLSEIDAGDIIHIESTIAGDKCGSVPSHLILKNLDNDSIPLN